MLKTWRDSEPDMSRNIFFIKGSESLYFGKLSAQTVHQLQELNYNSQQKEQDEYIGNTNNKFIL